MANPGTSGFGRKTKVRPATKDELDEVPIPGYGTKNTQDAQPIFRKNASGGTSTAGR